MPDRTCPSAPGVKGARAFGVTEQNGRVAYISPHLTVDQEFVDALGEVDLERRFRFAGRCIQHGCSVDGVLLWRDRCSAQ
jgi:hypothetical protein